jgi:hypothetical protein
MQLLRFIHPTKNRVFLLVLNAMQFFTGTSLKSKVTPVICPCYVCFRGKDIAFAAFE